MARPSTSLEATPFLDDDAGIKKQEQTPGSRPDGRKRRWSWSTALSYMFLTLFNALWFAANLLHTRAPGLYSSGEPTLVEPKDAPIEIETIRWDLPAGKRSNFTSYDRDVADAAWMTRGLGENQGWVKLSKEDLDAMGETSVEFHDGSGYLLYMDVFHQLHCLNYLRKKLEPWKSSYPSIPSDENFPEAYHTAHCIDSIRLSLECHADISLVPQRWADGWLEPWPVVQSQHVCRNYDKIQQWAHTKQPYVAGKIYHPQLGKVSTGHLNASALPVYWEEHDDI